MKTIFKRYLSAPLKTFRNHTLNIMNLLLFIVAVGCTAGISKQGNSDTIQKGKCVLSYENGKCDCSRAKTYKDCLSASCRNLRGRCVWLPEKPKRKGDERYCSGEKNSNCGKAN